MHDDSIDLMETIERMLEEGISRFTRGRQPELGILMAEERLHQFHKFLYYLRYEKERGKVGLDVLIKTLFSGSSVAWENEEAIEALKDAQEYLQDHLEVLELFCGSTVTAPRELMDRLGESIKQSESKIKE